MTVVTREEIHAVLGQVDDQVAAEIAATGATAEELAQAKTWLHNDEALVNEGHPLPSGRVAELIALLEVKDDEDVYRA